MLLPVRDQQGGTTHGCALRRWNQRISDTAPFKLVKTEPEAPVKPVADLVDEFTPGLMLSPSPGTSKRLNGRSS